MRGWAVALFAGTVACTDLRDFRGAWTGALVSESDGPEVIRAGFAPGAIASLEIERSDAGGFAGRLSVAGLVANAPLSSLPGADADALAGITFSGDPLRVYLSFASSQDNAGDSLIVISYHDEDRVELRVARAGGAPRYGLFPLRRAPVAALGGGAR